MSQTGLLHSIQSLGAVDGPGLRSIIVLQGCALHCKFCHSIDTTLMDRGERLTVEELVERIMKNSQYWGKSSVQNSPNHVTGGITITGGDPLIQPLFLEELVKELKASGVHLAVETSLFADQDSLDLVIKDIDLWMVSLKCFDEEKHEIITGKKNQKILENLSYLDNRLSALSKQGVKNKIRLRYVIAPEYADDEASIKQLGKIASKLENLDVVELLPYVTMGKYKWLELYGKYELEDIREASDEDLKRAEAILKGFAVPVYY